MPRAAEKMRRQSLAANRLMVFAHTNRFRPRDAQYDAMRHVAFPVATADTAKLIGAARRGLAALYRRGYRYKKAGVILLDLMPARETQSGLFDAADSAASKARMRAVDALNQRYGRDTETFALPACGGAGSCARTSFCRGLRRAGTSCCWSDAGRFCRYMASSAAFSRACCHLLGGLRCRLRL
jgi:hypothetical protein